MMRTLEENGIPVKYQHSENGGPGQVEIEVEFATLREMADRSQKLKYLIRNIAFQQGRTVSFMPKPFMKECGSGMHIHLQMFNGGKPIFYNEKGYSGLSDIALSAICGILRHSRALTALTNPCTNSYKRLVPGYEAPVTICFGAANRSAVIRIPGYARAPGDKRFEFRPPDASANPYLAYSALLMAAIDGIQKGLKPSPEIGPFEKNMEKLTPQEQAMVKALPHSLEDAADALEEDHAFLQNGGVFSDDIIRSHLAAIRREAAEVNAVPHPVEFQKYFDC
jgi:glutamine synthetase